MWIGERFNGRTDYLIADWPSATHIILFRYRQGSALKVIAFLTPVFAMIASAASAQATSDHSFFPAIMRGDIAGAEAQIAGDVKIADWEQARLKRKSLTPAEFFERVKPCYFRIAFAKSDDKNVEVGVWMCALTPTATNPNLSKTILVQASYQGDKVSLDSYSEEESAKPAPPAGQ